MPDASTYKGKLLSSTSPFAISEAFKMLRTNLMYTAKGETCPVFGITSSFAHSGKSLIIANLAVSFAQLNKRVLLLDCDLRNSVLHMIFDIDRANGMSELLAGVDNTVDKSLKRTTYNNLQLITSGGTPPNPAELLSSERMKQLIEFLKQHFDIIFIDMPPISVVTDAVVLSSLVTGYIFAVRSGMDDYKSLKRSISAMEQMNATIAGFVLNDVDLKTSGYYGSKYGRYGYSRHYGRYGYGKRYGYGYGYSKRYGYGYSDYGGYAAKNNKTKY